MVVAVDSELARELATGSKVESEFNEYFESVRSASDIDRLATDRTKTGVFLQRFAINPVNGERIPIWQVIMFLPITEPVQLWRCQHMTNAI